MDLMTREPMYVTLTHHLPLKLISHLEKGYISVQWHRLAAPMVAAEGEGLLS
jgi:hypothetical protein